MSKTKIYKLYVLKLLASALKDKYFKQISIQKCIGYIFFLWPLNNIFCDKISKVKKPKLTLKTHML